MQRRTLLLQKPRKKFTLEMHERMVRATLRPPVPQLPPVSESLKNSLKSRLPKVK